MGAEQFRQRASGSSAKEAFKKALEEALYNYGHAGYTGTLAEKDDFIEIPLPEGEDGMSYTTKLLDECDERIDDKWGPAGCISLGNNKYIFFGWSPT